MKFALNLFLFLFIFVMLGKKTSALTNYKIKKICEKEKRQSNCIKNLKEKRSNLQKGILIEIPVIPYKENYD